jgi:DNA-directed RNA polymerase sigma subunit (sigma70/sigma32)
MRATNQRHNSHRHPAKGARLTHAEIARRLGLSRQRIVQIEQAALAKVRRGFAELGVGPEELFR